MALFPVPLLCMLKRCEKRLKWSEQDKPSFDPSALRLEWGDATVSNRLCQLELEETASCLQGILYTPLLMRFLKLRTHLLALHCRTCDFVPECLSSTKRTGLLVFY